MLTLCYTARDGLMTEHSLNAYKLLHLQQMVTLVDLQEERAEWYS